MHDIRDILTPYMNGKRFLRVLCLLALLTSMPAESLALPFILGAHK